MVIVHSYVSLLVAYSAQVGWDLDSDCWSHAEDKPLPWTHGVVRLPNVVV